MRLLMRNCIDWAGSAIRLKMIHLRVGRAARHRRHVTVDSVPAWRLRRRPRCGRAYVSGRGVRVRLDVAEAGGALRANGSLEIEFRWAIRRAPRSNFASFFVAVSISSACHSVNNDLAPALL